MIKVAVPQLSWHNPRALELAFPDTWEVETHNIAGHNRPPLTAEQIKAALSHPIGMPPIRELARGKKQVVIIFDDLTRSTRVAQIAPVVLEELAAAGIPERNIRFIAGVGTHGPMTRPDLVKKLGEDVLRRFAVYNHNAFGDCVDVGTTSRGTKVMVNAEVMNCDLKIAIGATSPHGMTTFSGGGKNILPAVCARETIAANHAMKATPEERKDYDKNSLRLDIEEAARLAGLDVLIECLLNAWGETVALFAGTLTDAHAAAIKEAKKHYLATPAKDKDIVVSNVYIKAPEWGTGSKGAVSVRKGGDFVVLANSPDGQVNHYLMAGWGSTLRGGELGGGGPAHVGRIFLYNEYPVVGPFFHATKLQQMTSWNTILRALQEVHGGKAQVAVYPSADIMYLDGK
ncbi:MAG: DUF2088 domain-containing protein [Chloroflexi bacterium]|nr:DUF2088 domain-containing protein [Chloroflexota bacterium]